VRLQQHRFLTRIALFISAHSSAIYETRVKLSRALATNASRVARARVRYFCHRESAAGLGDFFIVAAIACTSTSALSPWIVENCCSGRLVRFVRAFCERKRREEGQEQR
jgi:hypothetical protein